MYKNDEDIIERMIRMASKRGQLFVMLPGSGKLATLDPPMGCDHESHTFLKAYPLDDLKYVKLSPNRAWYVSAPLMIAPLDFEERLAKTSVMVYDSEECRPTWATIPKPDSFIFCDPTIGNYPEWITFDRYQEILNELEQ